MTLPPIDPAMLAAMLDGTATAQERAEVLQALAADRERYAQFVEAVQVRAALDVDDALTATATTPERRESVAAAEPVVTLSARTTTRARPSQRLLAPLVLAAALVGVVLFMRGATVRAARDDGSVLQVAQAVEVPTRGNGAVAAALGSAGMDPQWTVLRGGASSRGASARAYRAGVRMAQLEIAVAAQDSSAVRLATDALAELMRGVDGAAPLTASLHAVAGGGTLPDLQERSTVSQQVRTLTGAAPWYDLGVWTESARHAAARPQPAFFRHGTFAMTRLQRLLAEPHDGLEWRDATEPLRGLIATTDTPLPMDVVLRALDRVAQTAGG